MSSCPGVKELGLPNTLYISMEVMVALAAVLGNILVVLVVWLNRALRNTTFCFMVSLALADISVGGLVIPLAITISLDICTHFYTCLFLCCLVVVITQSSILSLLAIAVDRYLRVKIPIRYSTIVTQKRAYVAVVLCWMVSFLTGLVPMMGWNNRHDLDKLSHNDSMVCNFTDVMTMEYMVYFNFFGCVVTPLLIMIALYGELFRVICRQLNRRAEATSDDERYYRKELKLAKSLALVVLLFAVCWLPLHIMNCVVLFYGEGFIPQPAINVGIFMSHVNSALNPLVYAFRIKSFRVTLLEITRRCTSCKARERSLYPCSMPALTEKVPHDPTESAK
ncbi:adenosine receptor A1-like [Nerophis ophidion]|uniref:adenosine receptor A1-like n=1 Tax=Nerophis ophidion TaxID=159077 RepID=UPI002ADF47BB|nr:adenosine receptor A1-like [Nerophis ophidion]